MSSAVVVVLEAERVGIVLPNSGCVVVAEVVGVEAMGVVGECC